MLIVPVQHLAAGLGHQDEVLHADAELAGQVDARLNRKDHTGSGYGGVRAADVALLVVGLADEMPQTVVEIRAVARFRNQVARGGVQLTQRAYASAETVQSYKALIARGVKVTAQFVPAD